jgi:hypothetical protein
LEVLIKEKSGSHLAVLWLKIKDLIDHIHHLEKDQVSEKEDQWFDLEPFGQLSLKFSFCIF